jgi:uncharacterized protein
MVFHYKTMHFPSLFKSLALIFLLAAWGRGQDLPRPAGFVSDFAGVLSPDEKALIEAVALQVQTKTGAEIAVVTVHTINGASLEEYVNRLFRQWGVGRKEKNNGVMIFAAINDRQVRIETGYGLEGALPDALCARIRDQLLLPQFKQEQYGQGLYLAAAAMARVIAKEAGVELELQQSNTPASTADHIMPELTFGQKLIGLPFIMLIVLLFIRHPRLLVLLWAMSQTNRGGRGGWSGGSGRGFGGGFGGFGGGMSGGGGVSGRW